jgi:hydrogenase nickel incorporation protein HypA/HybF
MINQINTIARQHHADKVTKVILHIGPLSGVEPQLLMQAFPLASAGTIASDAALVIEAQPIRVHCRSCEKESEATINRLICGHCGGHQTRVISGDEMLLANLELKSNV